MKRNLVIQFILVAISVLILGIVILTPRKPREIPTVITIPLGDDQDPLILRSGEGGTVPAESEVRVNVVPTPMVVETTEEPTVTLEGAAPGTETNYNSGS